MRFCDIKRMQLPKKLRTSWPVENVIVVKKVKKNMRKRSMMDKIFDRRHPVRIVNPNMLDNIHFFEVKRAIRKYFEANGKEYPEAGRRVIHFTEGLVRQTQIENYNENRKTITEPIPPLTKQELQYKPIFTEGFFLAILPIYITLGFFLYYTWSQ